MDHCILSEYEKMLIFPPSLSFSVFISMSSSLHKVYTMCDWFSYDTSCMVDYCIFNAAMTYFRICACVMDLCNFLAIRETSHFLTSLWFSIFILMSSSLHKVCTMHDWFSYNTSCMLDSCVFGALPQHFWIFGFLALVRRAHMFLHRAAVRRYPLVTGNPK